jgi:protein phosphatase
MQLTISELSLVVLIGASGSGKSTFARKHFRPTEVLSSDFCRGLVCDDEGSQAASHQAFEVLHFILAKRLELRRFTVVDATSLKAEARQELIRLARRYHYLTAAIVFRLPEELCQRHNQQRGQRVVPPAAIHTQCQLLEQALTSLPHERFGRVVVLSSPEEIDGLRIQRQPPSVDRSQDHGPFDLVGDVHGCIDELLALLKRLGYALDRNPRGPQGPRWEASAAPANRKLLFVGDLVDRGPNSAEVLRLVMDLSSAGLALCVRGNHDDKLLRYLRGNKVTIGHGLGETLAQIEREPETFRPRVRAFLECLTHHYLLADGRLVVAHGGLKESLQGRLSKRVEAFALFGDTTGEIDEYGLPVRRNWALDYHGRAAVIYGHTPVTDPVWVNRTLNIDTGCVFGGRLTALRYPEMELVSVPAARTYCPAPGVFQPRTLPPE